MTPRLLDPSALFLQILTNPSYRKALQPLSQAMQAQYKRRRPVQLAADVIENGLLTSALMHHRLDESDLSFQRTWGLDLLGVAAAVMTSALLVVSSGLWRIWSRLLMRGHQIRTSHAGAEVFVSAAGKSKTV